LERRLAQLADRLDVVVDDRLVNDVLVALDDRAHRRPSVRRAPQASARRAVWPVVVAAALAIAGVAAGPGTRHAVARWFGIGNTRFERAPVGSETAATFPAVPTSRAPSTSTTPTTAPGPVSTTAPVTVTSTSTSTSIGDALGIGD